MSGGSPPTSRRTRCANSSASGPSRPRCAVRSRGWQLVARAGPCRWGDSNWVVAKPGRGLLLVEVKGRRRCGADGWGVAGRWVRASEPPAARDWAYGCGWRTISQARHALRPSKWCSPWCSICHRRAEGALVAAGSMVVSDAVRQLWRCCPRLLPMTFAATGRKRFGQCTGLRLRPCCDASWRRRPQPASRLLRGGSPSQRRPLPNIWWPSPAALCKAVELENRVLVWPGPMRLLACDPTFFSLLRGRRDWRCHLPSRQPKVVEPTFST